MTQPRATLWLAMAAFACGLGSTAEDDGAPAPAPAPEPRTRDTAPPRLEAIPLPDDFPAEFPIPPGSIPVGASVEPAATGILASIELLDRSEADEAIVWFRNALSDLGWAVGEPDAGPDGTALQADRGESYVEIEVRSVPAGPGDDDRDGPWLYIEGEMWTVSP